MIFKAWVFISWEMNKRNLSLQEKQLMSICYQKYNWRFQTKVRILENLCLSQWTEQDNTSELSDEISGDINMWLFGYYKMKCVNIWMSCIIQWISNFQMVKIRHREKIYLKKGIWRDFYVTVYEKSIDMVPDSILWLTFNKYH